MDASSAFATKYTSKEKDATKKLDWALNLLRFQSQPKLLSPATKPSDPESPTIASAPEWSREVSQETFGCTYGSDNWPFSVPATPVGSATPAVRMYTSGHGSLPHAHIQVDQRTHFAHYEGMADHGQQNFSSPESSVCGLAREIHCLKDLLKSMEGRFSQQEERQTQLENMCQLTLEQLEHIMKRASDRRSEKVEKKARKQALPSAAKRTQSTPTFRDTDTANQVLPSSARQIQSPRAFEVVATANQVLPSAATHIQSPSSSALANQADADTSGIGTC